MLVANESVVPRCEVQHAALLTQQTCKCIPIVHTTDRLVEHCRLCVHEEPHVTRDPAQCYCLTHLRLAAAYASDDEHLCIMRRRRA